MDPVSITILIILIGLSSILGKLHIKRFKSGCISGDCYNEKDKSKRDSKSSLDLKDVSKVVFTDV
jgi:hypothetical protein